MLAHEQTNINGMYQEMLGARQTISDENFGALSDTDANQQIKANLIRRAIRSLPIGNYFFIGFDDRTYPELANNVQIRRRILEIYDCLISIMLQLYPQLGNRGGKLKIKRKRNKKSYKKRKGKRRKTKRKY